MKRWTSALVVAALMLFSTSAFSADYGVLAGSTYHLYEDADSAPAGFAKVEVSNFGIANLSIRTGGEFASTDLEGSGANLGIATWSTELAYDVPLAAISGLGVKAVAGLDALFYDVPTGYEADREIGGHLGAEVSYPVADGWEVVASGGYQFANLNLEPAEAKEVSLNNVYLGAAVKKAF